MEDLTNFGMKNSSTLPGSANKIFISLRDENDEPIYLYGSLYEKFCSEFNKGR